VLAYPILFFLLLLAQNGDSGKFAEYASQAEAARNADRLGDAIPLYRQALALKPSWAEGWFALGTIQYDQNNYKEAASALTKVVDLAPKQGTAQVMLGLCEFELGQDDSALRRLQEGRRIGLPDDPQLRNVALFHEGLLLQRAAKFESAQETLSSLCLAGVETNELFQILGMVVLRLRDNTPPASVVIPQVGHAECLAAQKKFEDARREFNAIEQSSSDFPNVHLAYGRFLLDIHDISAAIREFTQEVKNQPASPIARLQIAAAKYKIDSAGGLPFAEEAVKLDPALPLGHYLLGLLLLDTGDYERALPELETAQQSLPRETGVYYALGTAYARAGRKQDAANARATFLRLKSEESRVAISPQ
jgi:predicted Zn-dependent protease